ncbi:hypothetical protein D1007_61605 [Hordeum vulgare]|nr:hypothetical protein D1007_61605 [Hordeum vulgare]
MAASQHHRLSPSIHRVPSCPIGVFMADADSAAAYAFPLSPAALEMPSTQKRRQHDLVSRVWKGIFGHREDVEKLLQALSNEEDALRSHVHRRTHVSRTVRMAMGLGEEMRGRCADGATRGCWMGSKDDRERV